MRLEPEVIGSPGASEASQDPRAAHARPRLLYPHPHKARFILSYSGTLIHAPRLATQKLQTYNEKEKQKKNYSKNADQSDYDADESKCAKFAKVTRRPNY